MHNKKNKYLKQEEFLRFFYFKINSRTRSVEKNVNNQYYGYELDDYNIVAEQVHNVFDV